jgi:hypothetical protein
MDGKHEPLYNNKPKSKPKPKAKKTLSNEELTQQVKVQTGSTYTVNFMLGD